jgi:acyl-CoA synthetase (AMP-forming)/AMP-acid ligase II
VAFETRLTPALSARWRAAGLWSDETFASLLERRAAATPDRVAVTDGVRRLSYSALAHGIDRVAARLRSLGIGEGDVVTIQLPNWIEFPLVFFALERLGAVAVTVSVDFRSRELEYIMRFADAKMFVTCASFRNFDHLAMAEELRSRLPKLASLCVVRGAARPGVASLDDAVAAAGPPEGFVPVRQGADTVMRMAFTSGTTGNPKGVMHSHNTTLAAARILNGDLGLSSADSMMVWLPCGLNWGYLTLVQTVLAGAKAVLLERFQPPAALDLVERERVTYIPTAPASLTAILQELPG